MEAYFLAALQDVRLQCDFGFVINSGYRCPTWNKHVGGKSNSMHLKGLACDIKTAHLTGKQKHKLLKKVTDRFNGIGIYFDFIHVDLRSPAERTLWLG